MTKDPTSTIPRAKNIEMRNQIMTGKYQKMNQSEIENEIWKIHETSNLQQNEGPFKG